MNKIFLILLITIFGLQINLWAQGDLLITPKRVVFEGNKQKEQLILINLGQDTTTYSVSFVQRSMQENGSFSIIDKEGSGQMFSDPYLRIFPRTVTLAPKEPQVIALQFRRKSGMKEGEYRSHLFFRSEKNYNPAGLVDPSQDTTLMSVQIIPIYGITIPIIIRVGKGTANTTLSNIEIDYTQNTSPVLKLVINRTGNNSIYGTISVEYIPENGKPYEIGIAKGVGVYTEINKRSISIKLNKITKSTILKGKLKVKYFDGDDIKKNSYAEAELELK
ncbi:MAG: hypothetical protein JKX79_10935 [Labilibaculum sp.]|nr:hypothetical protein [Labilibaculum sp.]